MQKSISVIIPIYNMEKYLKECLNTVVTQELENIEIICVNDGSTDKSLEILKEYSGKYKNIIIIEQENQGVSVARNIGIEKATGKYVAFIDPDDFYPDNKVLLDLYYAAEEQNVLICGGKVSIYVDADKGIIYNEIRYRYDLFVNQTIEYNSYQLMYGFFCYIYNRELLIENKIVFPYYIRYQDPVFFVKAMEKAEMFYALDRIVYRHRIGIKGSKFSIKQVMHHFSGVKELLTIAKNNCYRDLFIALLRDTKDMYIKKIIPYSDNDNEELNELIENINTIIKNVQFELDEDLKEFYINMDKLREIKQRGTKMKKSILKNCQNYKEVYVYGAGANGITILQSLKEANINNISGFVVTDVKSKTVIDFSVTQIDEIVDIKEEVFIIVAVSDNIQHEIIDTLENYQFKNYIVLTQDEIMSIS